ncbi:MAG: AmmeMemoRadiSam system protein B [Chitinispirillales bacterium]|jgi:AmmeMemoRadiSam system protein B|nr:AmmeMemoRadiSam system protein B [Chitinispirillales bacterium]
MNHENKIRKAAAAGKFYPSSPSALREEAEEYLSIQNSNALPSVNMLIAPHAGYVFSGAVAAGGYARVSKDVKNVFLIGPSHYQWFNGVHVSDARYFETPLGVVEVNQDIVKRLRDNPFCSTVPDAEKLEHCLEVQLPFLQILLGRFTIIPVLTGKVNPSVIAEMLLPFLDDTSLVIASSDLSHFFDQNEARRVDNESIKTIMTGLVDGFIDGCGETAVRVVMDLAKRLGLHPQLLDARTSYETAPEYGSPDRVVGYVSIVYVP